MWRNSKIWLLFTAVLCFAGDGDHGQVKAWQARGNYHNKAYPERCVYNDATILSVGDTIKSPDTCAEIHCDDKYGNVTISGCGAVAPPDGCEWDGYLNVSAPFQKCCAQKLKCEGGLNNQARQELQAIWHMFSPDLIVPGLVQGSACSKGVKRLRFSFVSPEYLIKIGIK